MDWTSSFPKLHSTLELPNGTIALKDGKQLKDHLVILAATNTMAHTHYGDLQQLFVWKAGVKQASISTPNTAQ